MKNDHSVKSFQGQLSSLATYISEFLELCQKKENSDLGKERYYLKRLLK